MQKKDRYAEAFERADRWKRRRRARWIKHPWIPVVYIMFIAALIAAAAAGWIFLIKEAMC